VTRGLSLILQFCALCGSWASPQVQGEPTHVDVTHNDITEAACRFCHSNLLSSGSMIRVNPLLVSCRA
jgi:hypothetical protein